MKYVITALFILSIVGCGSGGNSAINNPTNNPDSIQMVLGDESYNVADIQNGFVNVTFPAATGDQPVITNVSVNGLLADGVAIIPDPVSGPYSVNSDGIDLYMPFAGTYNVALTVEDAGDAPVNRSFSITIPNSQSFILSGNVEDGPLGSETGVQTDVRLYWNPVNIPDTEIALQKSNASNNGSFTFIELIGLPSNFEVRVDGNVQ